MGGSPQAQSKEEIASVTVLGAVICARPLFACCRLGDDEHRAMLILRRTQHTRQTALFALTSALKRRACLHISTTHRDQAKKTEAPENTKDPRITDVEDQKKPVNDKGELIEDDFALLKSSYDAPKHPIILAHGLLGFDELRPLGKVLPVRGIEYWYGIKEALAAKNVEVITASVPPSGRIEVRAQRLAESIERQAGGKAVNIIAYVFF